MSHPTAVPLFQSGQPPPPPPLPRYVDAQMLDILTEDYHKAGKPDSAPPPVGLPPGECAAAVDAGSTAVIDMRNAPPPIEPVQWVPPEPAVSTRQVQAHALSRATRTVGEGRRDRRPPPGFCTACIFPLSPPLFFCFLFCYHVDVDDDNYDDGRRHPRPLRTFSPDALGCSRVGWAPPPPLPPPRPTPPPPPPPPPCFVFLPE